MPFNFDFSKCANGTKEVEVSPKGWKTPLKVIYGIAQAHPYDTMLSVCWKVEGTSHTFTIYERRLNHLSGSHYAEHFTEALEGFRKDYLSWFKEPGEGEYDVYANADWKWEYEKEFGGLILPD